MSRQINQPINQVRLTNVAVVRYNAKGKRFEIACYRNKVLDYRQGLETDLSEVLQTDRIFTNVSKGQFANSSQLEKCFGTRDQEAIAKLILQKGNSLQVSDLERNQQYEQRLQQIATWVAHNCVDGATQRQFSVAAIRQALEQHQFNGVQPHKAIKKQYLDAVKFLQQFLPSLQRAKMELLLEYPTTAESQVEALLAREPASRQVVMQRSEPSDSDTPTRTVTIQVDPSLYRDWNELAKQHASRLEIVQQAVVRQGDVNLQVELAQRQQQQHKQQLAAAELESKDVGAKETVAEPELVSESVAVPKEEASEEEDGVRHDDEKKDRDVDDEPVVKLSKKEQRRRAKKTKKAQRREEKEQAEAQLRAERQEEEDEHETASTTVKPAASAPEALGNEAKVLNPKTHKSCNTCGGSFAINSAEYRAHFRSDWHRFNQKLQLQGKPPVSEQEFQLCDVDTFFTSEYDDN